MKLTRIVAIAVIAAAAALNAPQAQTLRKAQPPAEFPPASYKGKQYVDSRGCVYIRAGIDGNVTWVPRVTRSRKQVCGYQPTRVAGTTRTPPAQGPAPQVITLAPEGQAAAPAAAAPAPASQATARAKPKAQPQQRPAAARPSPGPAPTTRYSATVQDAGKATGQTAPAATTTQRRPKPAATPTTGRQPSPGPEPTTRYSATIQDAQKARQPAAPSATTARRTPPPVAAAPQPRTPSPGPAPTVRYSSTTTAPNPAAAGAPDGLSPQTRIVPRHVYERRQNTTNVSVPKGYRRVWTDDRLNPHRAERTARAAQVTAGVTVPRGYRMVRWEDDRLNPNRGGTARGDAQTDRIWTRDIPRRLVPVPAVTAVASLPEAAVPVQDPQTRVTRLSTRSAPEAAAIYVRAADFDDEGSARAAADSIAVGGLPVRLGVSRPSGKRLVLAGPFASEGQAKAALRQLRGQGYRRARILK